MKTVSARYRGNRLVELNTDIPLAEDAPVLVIIPGPEDAPEAESGWPQLTASQFLAGYAEADAVYDSL